ERVGPQRQGHVPVVRPHVRPPLVRALGPASPFLPAMVSPNVRARPGGSGGLARPSGCSLPGDARGLAALPGEALDPALGAVALRGPCPSTPVTQVAGHRAVAFWI